MKYKKIAPGDLPELGVGKCGYCGGNVTIGWVPQQIEDELWWFANPPRCSLCRAEPIAMAMVNRRRKDRRP